MGGESPQTAPQARKPPTRAPARSASIPPTAQLQVASSHRHRAHRKSVANGWARRAPFEPSPRRARSSRSLSRIGSGTEKHAREELLYQIKGGSLRSPPRAGCGRPLRGRPRRRPRAPGARHGTSPRPTPAPAPWRRSRATRRPAHSPSLRRCRAQLGASGRQLAVGGSGTEEDRAQRSSSSSVRPSALLAPPASAGMGQWSSTTRSPRITCSRIRARAGAPPGRVALVHTCCTRQADRRAAAACSGRPQTTPATDQLRRIGCFGAASDPRIALGR